MNTNIEIAFEHEDFIVVVKPPNVNFHDEGDLGQGFFNQCKTAFNQELYPVHRLDKVTSGLVVMAKSLCAAQWFQQAFNDKLITKFYIAISDQKPKKKQGSIKGDMAKARRGQWKLIKTLKNPAITKLHTVPLAHPGRRLFLLKPETGKTHQLRVAMKSLGSVIVGDELYGSDSADRVYLHAARLIFTYQDQYIDVTKIPTDGELFLAERQTVAKEVDNLLELNWPR